MGTAATALKIALNRLAHVPEGILKIIIAARTAIINSRVSSRFTVLGFGFIVSALFSPRELRNSLFDGIVIMLLLFAAGALFLIASVEARNIEKRERQGKHKIRGRL